MAMAAVPSASPRTVPSGRSDNLPGATSAATAPPLRGDRPRVLLVVGHYLPGFKAGGILRSVANIVDHLHGTFDFLVLTRDHDFGDRAPYPGVAAGGWQRTGHASVRYLMERETSMDALRQIVDEAACDVIYLNSFFEPICIKVLANLRRGRTAARPVVLAPRGEFAWPSLRIKYPKKLAFMLGARMAGMFRDVTWHAANEVEAAEIRRTMGVRPASIAVAIDLPTLRPEPTQPVAPPAPIPGNPLRVVFLSRISPEKNLEFALEVLKNVAAPVHFDIVGPLDHPDYWKSCVSQIERLPPNVIARHVGSVDPRDVVATLAGYDLMFFPSGAESYGHVIAEALAAGLPVLISNSTPWRGLEERGVGWDLPLDRPELFVACIDKLAACSAEERRQRRAHARPAALAMLSPDAAREAHASMFLKALGAARPGALSASN
jgi:glycosyltransferase involved in cell wall biosynthesis